MATFKPTYCVWELTLACDLRCRHCGSRAGKARPDELGTDECLAAVAGLADLGCEVVTLSGGEPTLRSDWSVIARAIRDHGMIVNMVTNGYALDHALAVEMKRAGLCNVGISIDGPEEVHDRIRGRGTFQRTSRAFRILRDVGLSATLMTTVNTLNVRRFDEIHAIALELGASRLRCQLGKPMGNLQDHDDLVIRPRDLLRLLPALHRLHEQGPIPVGIGDSIGYHGPYDTALRAFDWRGRPQCWAGCQAGMRTIGLEADGGVKGCLSMQAFQGGPDPFLEGNLRQRSLASIWNDPQGFAYNRRFSVDSLSGFCGRCGYRKSCRGGARCVAAAVTGELRENPYCFHRVATMTSHSALRVLQRHVAGAAAAVALATSGCGWQSHDEPRPTCEGADCSDPNLPGETRDECCNAAEYGVDPCADVSCVEPNAPGECCASADYGAEPDYGVEPCGGIDCTDPDLPAELRDSCCVSDDYAVDPCFDADCSDPDLPADVRDQCCVMAEYGAEPVDPCLGVDCAAPDPNLPVPAYEQCCGAIDCASECETTASSCDCGDSPLPQTVGKCCDEGQ